MLLFGLFGGGGGGGGGVCVCVGGGVWVWVWVWVWVCVGVFICLLLFFFYIHTWNHAITEKQTVMFIRSNFTEIALFFQLIRTYTNISHSFIQSFINSIIHSFIHSSVMFIALTLTTTEFNL